MEGSLLSGIPYTWDEGLIILGLVSILLLIVMVLSYYKKLGLEKEFPSAFIKGGIQLFVVAVILYFLFDFEYWYFPIWLLIAVMAVVGGLTSAKRATHMPKAWEITTPSILLGAGIVLVILGITQAMPMKPQFIIPLAGMAFGNSMRICSLALDRLIREVKVNRVQVETYLSLGASSKIAMKEFGKISIKTALIPTLDSLKTLGLIFIPGAMAGLLIAGTDPILAAEYQIIVYLMIVGGGMITSMIAVFLARKKIFNSSEQISQWILKEKDSGG
jgi:putative ABC transport system permease protein